MNEAGFVDSGSNTEKKSVSIEESKQEQVYERVN
jgi:hypothetical protein